MSVTFIEIYNEEIYDLLAFGDDSAINYNVSADNAIKYNGSVDTLPDEISNINIDNFSTDNLSRHRTPLNLRQSIGDGPGNNYSTIVGLSEHVPATYENAQSLATWLSRA